MIELRFHHVGVGTTDFEGAIECYQGLGHRLHRQLDDPGLNVRVAFLSGPRGIGPWIEVLAPLGPDGPLKALLARRSLPAPYHTCYAVDDLERATEHVRLADFVALTAPKPALAFGNQRVAFFFNRSIGLIELVERPPSELAPFGDARQVQCAPSPP